jgi:LysR substrate binding domain
MELEYAILLTDGDGTAVEETMMIALPSDHPLVKASALPLSALAKDQFLLFPRSVGPGFFDEIIAACRRAGFEPRMGY